MAYIAVDRNGDEYIYSDKPIRCPENYPSYWFLKYGVQIELPKGSIKKLIDRDLTWKDDCVEI